PLFVLGIWWSRLTPQGAAVGMLAGGVCAIGAIVLGLALGASGLGGALQAILTQPAIISVPVGFGTMIAISLRTRPPADVRAQMLTLHAPEGLGLETLERARA
ncbi:MAG: hypothetical protein JO156_13155, partial [Solirubrobacterales bacterium]|nr:hypothetical protein [Solirubrobacterales bacterium]